MHRSPASSHDGYGRAHDHAAHDRAGNDGNGRDGYGRDGTDDGYGRDDTGRLFIGIDAGKVTTSLVWGRLGADGAPVVEGHSDERHRGEPLAAFFTLYRNLGAERVAGVVGAGTFGDRLTAPALAGIPEEIAQEMALRALYGERGPLNVVRIGGSGYSVLTRDVHALYDRAKVDGPVVLVGHGALIGPLVDAFRELVTAPVEVSPQAGVFEALGAFQIAASRAWGEVTWPPRPEELVVERRGRVRALVAAIDGPGSVLQLAE